MLRYAFQRAFDIAGGAEQVVVQHDALGGEDGLELGQGGIDAAAYGKGVGAELADNHHHHARRGGDGGLAERRRGAVGDLGDHAKGHRLAVCPLHDEVCKRLAR